MGQSKVIIAFLPQLNGISRSGYGSGFALYNGMWWSNDTKADGSGFRDARGGGIEIALGGALATVPRNMAPIGKLPLLPGDKGFYIEFEARISSNDKDAWPALWLMPIEHNGKAEDSYNPDPMRYERWQEIDVDEGGFAPGPMGTAIAWKGKSPAYEKTRSNPNLNNKIIDRTIFHTFGAGYDPTNLTVSFWFDNQLQYVATEPAVTEYARRQNFYVIVNAASHGKRVPYILTVKRIRAFISE